MALFGKQKSYVGVDIGTSSIKVCELTNEAGRPKLVTYGYIEESVDIVKSDLPQAQARVLALLKKLLREAHVGTDQVVAALPSYAVFTSIISLPKMAEKDLLAAVRWEAKKFVPMPIEEMILDWRLMEDSERQAPSKPAAEPKRAETMVGQNKKPMQDQKILLTAAPKNLVQRYVSLFKALEVQLVSLETESFALERSLIGSDPSPIMLIDIGSVATDISVVVRGVPVLSRSIDVGGTTITKAIMNSLNVDEERAEQFKRDFGMATGQEMQQIPKTIEFILSSIINESRYCLNLFQAQAQGPVEKVVLAGGSSFLPQLPNFLSSTLNLKVFIGDPWARVAYPVELQETLQHLAPRFAVSIGLALRHIV